MCFIDINVLYPYQYALECMSVWGVGTAFRYRHISLSLYCDDVQIIWKVLQLHGSVCVCRHYAWFNSCSSMFLPVRSSGWKQDWDRWHTAVLWWPQLRPSQYKRPGCGMEVPCCHAMRIHQEGVPWWHDRTRVSYDIILKHTHEEASTIVTVTMFSMTFWQNRNAQIMSNYVAHNNKPEVVGRWLKWFELVLFICSSYRCDSPEKLKSLLPRLEQELKDSGKFKDFYQFTFNFAKNPGQKGLGSSKKLKNT